MDEEVRTYQIAFLTNECGSEHPLPYFRLFPPVRDSRGLAGGGMFLYRYFPAGGLGLPLSCRVEIVVLREEEEVSRTEVTLDPSLAFSLSDTKDPDDAIADHVVERSVTTRGSPTNRVLVRILINNPTNFHVAVGIAAREFSEECSREVGWSFGQSQSYYGIERGVLHLAPMGWKVATLPLVAPPSVDLSGCTATITFHAINSVAARVNRKQTTVELVPRGKYKRVLLH